MYNQPTEFDKGFRKGLEIGQKIGFFEAKIQTISGDLGTISGTLSSIDSNNYETIINDLDFCIQRLDNLKDQLSDIC